MVMPLFNTAPAYRMPIFNPLPIYRPPILSGLTYTGLPHPLTTVLPSYSGPSPSLTNCFQRLFREAADSRRLLKQGSWAGLGVVWDFSLRPPSQRKFVLALESGLRHTLEPVYGTTGRILRQARSSLPRPNTTCMGGWSPPRFNS